MRHKKTTYENHIFPKTLSVQKITKIIKKNQTYRAQKLLNKQHLMILHDLQLT